MTTASGSYRLARPDETRALRDQWRVLTRAATFVALLTSPAVFIWLYREEGWSVVSSLVATLLLVMAFRGMVELVFRRFIPWPTLFGVDDTRLREEDVLGRRRAWFWARLLRWTIVLGSLGALMWWLGILDLLASLGPFALLLPLYLIFNFVILFGPLMLMGITQMRGFEPGDADWGVQLEDVRGQAEAKDEVRKIVELWQSGEQFVMAGGKRERGILFLGAPGTGKTMLAKAIATGFNSPIVTIPGSGFAQTFIGMDVVIVRWLARKAKKLASKWGGQCIVFIDEVDAIGMRRSALGGGAAIATPGATPDSFHDHCFYGPFGALNPSGDLILENRDWRERLFAARAPDHGPIGSVFGRLGGIVTQMAPGMFGGGGQLALNQLLVVMDGIDNPPFFRRMFTNLINTILDATFIMPRRIRGVTLRLPRAKPSGNQIYFIGATNVPISSLDPALTRPGRLGRHVWFRTPTKKDREDIFELYLGKVAHEPELDEPARREELARITNGYAQPLDSQLLTPKGWKKMGDVEVGDLLVGASGAATPVVAVHPRGEMDVFRVTFNDGTFTECTADHLWTVEALDPRMLRRTFTLAELMQRGLRWSPKGSPFYLPKMTAAGLSDSGELPLDPYLLGLLLSNGGFTSTTPDFCTADEENLMAVDALLPVGVSVTRHGPKNWWLSGGSRRGVPRSRPNPLTAQLREVGLWGIEGREKFIPEPYKWSGAGARLALLQGLMDTDGTRDYRRGTGPVFHSHSHRLAADVAFLTRSLGGTARMRAKKDGWRVALDLPEGMVPFRLTRKAADYRSSRKPFRKRIVKVEPVGRQLAQCVTVAAHDGLYVTDGFTVTHNSPAMIEQVCSMALTYAHHEARQRFTWEDITEAMTTVESGTAVGIDYVPEESRAVAIHEAGHAATAHVYMKGAESTRLSIRMRSGSLGHHQALEKEERFSRFRSEEMAQLVWALGAMAAEHAFYGENTTGVGGDVQSATARAAWMVGTSAMAPDPIPMNDKLDDESDDEARQRIEKRFEEVGTLIMNRAGGGGALHHDPIASVLSDPAKRRLVALMLGQAYVYAYNLVKHNKPAVEHIADTLIERKELYGNELLQLLDQADLQKPEIDLAKDEAWPAL